MNIIYDDHINAKRKKLLKNEKTTQSKKKMYSINKIQMLSVILLIFPLFENVFRVCLYFTPSVIYDDKNNGQVMRRNKKKNV